MDYAIPRSQILAAKKELDDFNTTVKLAALQAKARRLFTEVATTGEPGEVLLYMFAQSVLGVPQLTCKMPLKTNSNVHYHGADGLHIGVEPGNTSSIRLYWGEAKCKADFSDALEDAVSSLLPYISAPAKNATRDLELARDNLDLLDETLQDALLKYLDPDDPAYNSTRHCGLCLVGFDVKQYPTDPSSIDSEELLKKIRTAFRRWHPAVKKRLDENPPLPSVVIEFFLLPLPSVQSFRDDFLEALRDG